MFDKPTKPTVEKNKNIFTKEEMNVILNNVNLIEKIYFLGALDVQ